MQNVCSDLPVSYTLLLPIVASKVKLSRFDSFTLPQIFLSLFKPKTWSVSTHMFQNQRKSLNKPPRSDIAKFYIALWRMWTINL